MNISFCLSILRYIAVTRPIQYAKHRNSRRVHVTLALTWVVSIAVSSPIALGANYTERRSQTPWLCTFYNSNFLIGSSMTSFYIPCLLMILLYWRTFRAISARARKMAAMSGGRKSVMQTTAQTGKGNAVTSTTRTMVVDASVAIHLDAIQSAVGSSTATTSHIDDVT